MIEYIFVKVLMEVEASNSTVTHLRERSAQYYQLQPLLYSVVAIKLFGGGTSCARHCISVFRMQQPEH